MATVTSIAALQPGTRYDIVATDGTVYPNMEILRTDPAGFLARSGLNLYLVRTAEFVSGTTPPTVR